MEEIGLKPTDYAILADIQDKMNKFCERDCRGCPLNSAEYKVDDVCLFCHAETIIDDAMWDITQNNVCRHTNQKEEE